MKWLYWVVSKFRFVSPFRSLALLALAGNSFLLVACSQDEPGPNEIAFQSLVRYEDGKITRRARPATWRLKIPDEFVVRKNPYGNGKPFTPWAKRKRGWFGYESNPKNGDSASVLSLLSSDSKVVPYRPPVGENVPFGISFQNSLVRTAISDTDYCMTNEQLVQEPVTDYSLLVSKCLDITKGCSIYLNYYGWPVELSVEKLGLYKNPKQVCGILRSTVDAWTISVDDLRKP